MNGSFGRCGTTGSVETRSGTGKQKKSSKPVHQRTMLLTCEYMSSAVLMTLELLS